MIKKIVKLIQNNNQVSDYLISENKETSHQAFFVLGKLETTRLVEVTEYEVTVYVRHDDKIGSSTFIVSHKLSNKELEEKINEAVKAAKFVFNKDYNLVNGLKKKTVKDNEFSDSFDDMLNKINGIMQRISKPNIKFNAVEIFYDEKTIHLLNSRGVNLTKTNYSLNIESIPSYDGDKDRVEIYKMDRYNTLDYQKIEEDMVNSLNDVRIRYEATKLPKAQKIDIVLREKEIEEFFYEYISDYGYAVVYSGGTDKKIGDTLQEENAKTKLTISLTPSSKSNFFDNQGVLLKKNTIIENGVLKSYYGSNQYGQYIGIEPTGVADELLVKKGSKSAESITKGKYIEIISLSGIQVDMHADYIGGEVRLGVLHDKDKTIPLNGFSFSTSFSKAINNLVLSKETVKIHGYQGPKLLRIKGVEVM